MSSPLEVYVKAYAMAEDPSFNEQTLLNYIRLAGESKKKILLFFIRDEWENKNVDKYDMDDRFKHKALSTLMYFGHHNFDMNIDNNFCKEFNLSTSTEKAVVDITQNCYIINPEDNNHSSSMCAIVLFPTHIFDKLQKY